MAKTERDDLEAVRDVIAALEGFQSTDQERILRWAREKLGLPPLASASAPVREITRPPGSSAATQAAGEGKQQTTADIRTFVQSKSPQSDVQFAATVAYYYRFEAPEGERRETITADDLQEATRKVGRERLGKASQTLINAHNLGVLDKGGERGAYAINTVGENLVAMTLPGGGTGVATNRRPASRSTSKRAQKKSKAKTNSRSKK